MTARRAGAGAQRRRSQGRARASSSPSSARRAAARRRCCARSPIWRTPTGGAIRVNGMSPQEARANRAYGYVFQAPALYPWRSVERNIALPLEIMGYHKAERDARVAKGLELVNLDRLRQEVSLAIVGRHAAARLDRPRAVVRSRPSADGRAVRRARRDRARHAEPAVAAAVGRDAARPCCSSPIRSPRRCSCRPASS